MQIHDCPHAAEHLVRLFEALETLGSGFPPQMLERCSHVLTHRAPDSLARLADRLIAASRCSRAAGIWMQYPTFCRAGWPICSGMIESANKLVVAARLKGTAMRWERMHVNPTLALRNGVCNERRQETWQIACHNVVTRGWHNSTQPGHIPIEPPLTRSSCHECWNLMTRRTSSLEAGPSCAPARLYKGESRPHTSPFDVQNTRRTRALQGKTES